MSDTFDSPAIERVAQQFLADMEREWVTRSLTPLRFDVYDKRGRVVETKPAATFQGLAELVNTGNEAGE